MRIRRRTELLTRATVVLQIAFAGLILPTLTHAGASPTVYHCPDSSVCTNPGTPYAFAGSSATIELFLAPGTNPSTGQEICFDGSGDEICGFTLEIVSTGDLSITSFSPNMSAGTGTEGTDIIFFIDPVTNALRINRINGLAGDAVELWLGTLVVSNSANGGEIRLDGASNAVSANLELVPVLHNGPIAVPEPSFRDGHALRQCSARVRNQTQNASADRGWAMKFRIFHAADSYFRYSHSR